MVLISACVIGFILFIALLIFVLRLFSITLFNIPGFDLFFQFVIISIPYIIFFAAYYYLFKKVRASKSVTSRLIARVLLVAGAALCIFTLVLSTLIFLKEKNEWLAVFNENSHFALIIQLIILLVASGIIASGDAKEKDWMERS